MGSQSVAKYYWHHKKNGKFNKNKGANHQRVEEANRTWHESNHKQSSNELQFVSAGNHDELTQKFNKTKLNKPRNDSKYDQKSSHREHHHNDKNKKHRDRKEYDRKSHRDRYRNNKSRSRSRSRSRDKNDRSRYRKSSRY